MRCTTGILLFAVTAIVAGTEARSSSSDWGVPFTVPPDSEALVFNRNGNIKRLVGPGLHTYVPFFETVLIEKTTYEKGQELTGPWTFDDCDITVTVIWRISDLKLYHEGGREMTVVPMIETLVQDTLRLTDTGIINRESVSEHLFYALRETWSLDSLGVEFARINSNLENCAPE